MVDRHGVAHFCPHLHDMDGVDVRHELATRRAEGATTVVVNDATAACWAEHVLGSARGVDDVLDDHPGHGHRRGARSWAGGSCLGLTVSPEKWATWCSTRTAPRARAEAGVLGALCVRDGPGRLAREAAQAGRLDEVVRLVGGDPEAVRGEHLTSAALAGDPGALEVMETFAWGWPWAWPTWPTPSTPP